MGIEHTMQTRREFILELLKKSSSVKVSELSEMLDISDVTIRSDLSDLEKEGLLDRVHGGAVSRQRHYPSIHSYDKDSENIDAKKKIAKSVASLIKPGETVMINSGSSTYFIARELTHIRNLNIVTNSLAIATELSNLPNINLILLGGTLNSDFSFTFGDDAITQLKRYRADKLILSVDGISVKNGLSTFHYLESKLNQTMIERSNCTYVVADSSKLGKESFSFIEPLNKVSALITDADVDNSEIKKIISAGVEVVTC